MGLMKHGKVPIPIPPHVAEGVKESRALYDIVKQQDRQGAHGDRPGRACARLGSSTPAPTPASFRARRSRPTS